MRTRSHLKKFDAKCFSNFDFYELSNIKVNFQLQGRGQPRPLPIQCLATCWGHKSVPIPLRRLSCSIQTLLQQRHAGTNQVSFRLGFVFFFPSGGVPLRARALESPPRPLLHLFIPLFLLPRIPSFPPLSLGVN